MPDAELLAKYGKMEISINGVEVTEASNMEDCHALKHENGHVWKPNDAGKYEIAIHIKNAAEWSFLHISSFILL